MSIDSSIKEIWGDIVRRRAIRKDFTERMQRLYDLGSISRTHVIRHVRYVADGTAGDADDNIPEAWGRQLLRKWGEA